MYPEYVEVNGKQYPINTDFRVAIECNKIAEDKTIGNLERALAVIYLLFGDEALVDITNLEKWLELAKKYLSCGKEYEPKIDEKPDMDFEQDYGYIWASFMSDYNMDIDKIEMHWWKFYELLNGLSNSELGDCCILNRIRNLRNYNTKDIKDKSLKDKMEKAKKQVALKKQEQPLTEQQIRSRNELREKLGIREE